MKRLAVATVMAILFASVSIGTTHAQQSYDIPAWVKGIAGFWANGEITDDDFGEGISFLIEQKIIEIPMIKDLENQVIKLESENKNLKGDVEWYEKENAELKTKINSKDTSSSNLNKQESITYGCPTSHPYEWSDGLCYDQPEYYDNGCPYGYPYIWNDGQCYVIPEITYDEPEDTTPSCSPYYPDVCIASYPPDLDCDEISYSNFRVPGYDPHGFDRDNDGIGCES